MFMKIKKENSISDGARHVFEEIRLAKAYCTSEEFEIVKKTIQQNCFFLHPENIVLAMCG